jgi:hypothetical protein
MELVTQNCRWGIGGKAVWANRKGVWKIEEVTLFSKGRRRE